MKPRQETVVQAPPTVCSKHHKPAVQHLVVVATLSGIEQRGPFWQFGRYDRSRRKVKLLLKPEYRFVRWDSRCEQC